MNIRISLGAAISLMLLVAALTFTITYDFVTSSFNNSVNAVRERENSQAKYAEIDREVRANYYGVIDEAQLLDSVARGYLAGIGDNYATYYDAKSYERLLRSQDSPAADIGAVLRENPDGYLMVTEVYPDSPASGSDMQPGDLIIKIDDTDLTPENSAQMLASIPGEQGTTVTLVVRSGTSDTTVSLTRRVVIVPSVYTRMIGDTGVGYLIIKEFGDHTLDQFKREIRKLISSGASSIILDVRDSKGGKLTTATRILDFLLPSGVIVSSLDRDGAVTVLATSDASEIDLPIVVLQNSGTADVAELFVQALKDYDKAKTDGTLSAGRGVMQKLIKLSDGSALEITMAKLLPPNGESFDGIGVKADYEVTIEGDWHGLDEELDPQLKKARDVAVGMKKTSEALLEQSSQPSQPASSSQPQPPPPQPEPEPESSQPSTEEPEDTLNEQPTQDDEERSLFD